MFNNNYWICVYRAFSHRENPTFKIWQRMRFVVFSVLMAKAIRIIPRAPWNSCEEIFRIKNTRFILLKTLKFSYYVFDLYSAFSTRFTNNQRRFQFIKMWYTHHSIFNVVFLKAIKNPVLCMLPPRALLTVLRRVQLGFETRASLPFFRAMTL